MYIRQKSISSIFIYCQNIPIALSVSSLDAEVILTDVGMGEGNGML